MFYLSHGPKDNYVHDNMIVITMIIYYDCHYFLLGLPLLFSRWVVSPIRGIGFLLLCKKSRFLRIVCTLLINGVKAFIVKIYFLSFFITHRGFGSNLDDHEVFLHITLPKICTF